MVRVTHLLEAHVVTEGDWIGATEICQLCRIDFDAVQELAELGVLEPRRSAGTWQVPAAALPRLRIVGRAHARSGAERQRCGPGAGAAGEAARARAAHPRAGAPGERSLTEALPAPCQPLLFRGRAGAVEHPVAVREAAELLDDGAVMLGRAQRAGEERAAPRPAPRPARAGRRPPTHPAPRGSRRAAAACRRRSAPPHPAPHPRPTASPRGSAPAPACRRRRRARCRGRCCAGTGRAG